MYFYKIFTNFVEIIKIIKNLLIKKLKLVQVMERVTILDVVLKGYNDYQRFIEKLYPDQPLFLEISENSNGYEQILVKSNLGIIGELYSEDASVLLPYLKKTDKFYIKTSLKKHYIKESIKLAVVVIIEVFKKNNDFIEPVPLFFGDYITNYDKYIFGGYPGEDYDLTYFLTNLNFYKLEELNEYDPLFLKIYDDIVEVYRVGRIKTGELNKKASSKIINYLQNQDYSVEAHVKKATEQSCSVEFLIKKKRYIKKTKYLKDKSLLIEGVEVINDNGCALSDEEKKLILSDEYTLEEDIRRTQEKRRQEKEKEAAMAPFYSTGCVIGLIGLIGLFGLIFRLIFITSEGNETTDVIFNISVVFAIIGIIPFFLIYIKK